MAHGDRNVGQFAALSRADVASRFGADAVAARFARGEPNRGPSGREPPPELDAVMDCDPPIDRVDAAAFAGRSLASDLHRSLESAGVGCTRLAIHAVTANGEELNRVWRCAEPLTEDATADRALAAGRLAESPQSERQANRTDHRAAAATGGSGVGRGVATAAVGGVGERTGCARPHWFGFKVCSGRRPFRCRCSAEAAACRAITLTPLGDEPVPRADPGQPAGTTA